VTITVKVRPVIWHPDEMLMAAISAAPMLPPIDLYETTYCSCGRLLLDREDGAHDKVVTTHRGTLHGSFRCAASDFYSEPHDRDETPLPRVAVWPPASPSTKTAVPQLVSLDADPTARLADALHGLLGALSGSWGDLETAKADARAALATVGGAA